MKRKIFSIILCIIILGVLFIGCSKQNKVKEVSDSKITEEKEGIDDETEVKETEEERIIYGEGEYIVGDTIPAGEYIFYQTGNNLFGGIEIREGSKDGKLICESFISRNSESTVTLEEGDYLLSQAVDLRVPTQDTPFVNMEKYNVRGGIYKVGMQIPEGKYIVTYDKGAGEAQDVKIGTNNLRDFDEGVLKEYKITKDSEPLELDLENGQYVLLGFVTFEKAE